MTEARPALAVEADLTLEVGGETVAVWADGERVVVDAPTLRAVLALLRGSRTLPLDAVGAGLASADLPVAVRVRRATVARLGPGAMPGAVEDALGVGPAAVSPPGVAVALGRALL